MQIRDLVQRSKLWQVQTQARGEPRIPGSTSDRECPIQQPPQKPRTRHKRKQGDQERQSKLIRRRMLRSQRIRMNKNLKTLQWEVEKIKARKGLRMRCLLMLKRSNRSNAGSERHATIRTAIGVSIKLLMENHLQLSLALKK